MVCAISQGRGTAHATDDPPLREVVAAQAALPAAIDSAVQGITAESVMAHVTALCDPELAGRRAGEPGARLAANYIADRFRRIGLRPAGQAGSYFQTFKIRSGYLIDAELTGMTPDEKVQEPASTKSDDAMPASATKPDMPAEAEAREGLLARRDFMPVHVPNGEAAFDAPVALAGFGVRAESIGFDEYAGLDCKDHAVLVFAGVPWDAAMVRQLRKASNTAYDSLSYKAQTAAKHGAVALLVVDMPTKWSRTTTRHGLLLPDMLTPIDSPIPVLHITPDCASQLTGVNRDDLARLATDLRTQRKAVSRTLPGQRIRFKASITGDATIGRNVVAVLPGSDATLRREAIVIGAHFDHLGERAGGIFFGANDNASGVAALLEIARAVAALQPRPRRSIIFAAFGAEEIGRLGSNHYVAHPPVSLKNTALMINFDMVGRNQPDQLYVVASKSSDELHQLHQRANHYVDLKLLHPESFRLGRSDHTAFYYNQVPVMYLFGGLHAGYHSVDDRASLLEPEKIVRAANLAMLTALTVADLDKRPTFQPLPPEHPFLQKPRRLP